MRSWVPPPLGMLLDGNDLASLGASVILQISSDMRPAESRLRARGAARPASL